MNKILSIEEQKIDFLTNWIHKGFFEDEILKENYIQKEAILKEIGVEWLVEKSSKEYVSITKKLRGKDVV